MGQRLSAFLVETPVDSHESEPHPSCKRPSLAKPRGAFFACLVALLFVHVVASPGHATSCEASSAVRSVSPSPQAAPQAIVIGFMGGFVAHDETHHPEVQMMQALRREYSKDIYFGLFENRKVDEANELILARLGAKEDGRLSEDEKRHACILLFGHSWGALAVLTLARQLAREGIPVMLTVQVDSVAKPFQNDWVIPPNVLQAVNFYQTHGLIHGRSRIKAADPSRTTILGNFQWEYAKEPEECRDFSWYARYFTKSHIEIECDPKVWSQVRTLLRSSLPAPLVTQAESGGQVPD